MAVRPCLTIKRWDTTYNFNNKVVDVVFASIESDQKERTAHVVDIQITVSKQRKDAEAAFFAELGRWFRELGSFKVETSFLRIYDERAGDSKTFCGIK